MAGSIRSIVEGAITVALIAGFSRWLLSTNDVQLPHKGAKHSTVYGTKWQLKAVAIATACVFAALPIWLRHDPDWPLLLIFTVGGAACVWLTASWIVTDTHGI